MLLEFLDVSACYMLVGYIYRYFGTKLEGLSKAIATGTQRGAHNRTVTSMELGG